MAKGSRTSISPDSIPSNSESLETSHDSITSAVGEPGGELCSPRSRSTELRDAPLAEFSDITCFLQGGEGAVQETGLAHLALNLAAGSLRQAPGLEQQRCVHSHVMLFCHRSPNGPNHRCRIQLQTPTSIRMGMRCAVVRFTIVLRAGLVVTLNF